jgi:hypothetical protein
MVKVRAFRVRDAEVALLDSTVTSKVDFAAYGIWSRSRHFVMKPQSLYELGRTETAGCLVFSTYSFRKGHWKYVPILPGS